jgi:hypothetical protein
MVLALAGLGAALYAPTVTLRRVVHDWLGGKSLMRQLTKGRVGQWLFGAAAVGLRDPQPRRVSLGEPTVVAIARAADELFLALPEQKRHHLGDVPAVIERLEAEALALRGGDGEAAEREASAVAALESLRLDLLRLSAGGTPKGELTLDLENAERISERIDARLATGPAITPVPNG